MKPTLDHRVYVYVYFISLMTCRHVAMWSVSVWKQASVALCGSRTSVFNKSAAMLLVDRGGGGWPRYSIPVSGLTFLAGQSAALTRRRLMEKSGIIWLGVASQGWSIVTVPVSLYQSKGNHFNTSARCNLLLVIDFVRFIWAKFGVFILYNIL